MEDCYANCPAMINMYQTYTDQSDQDSTYKSYRMFFFYILNWLLSKQFWCELTKINNIITNCDIIYVDVIFAHVLTVFNICNQLLVFW